MVVIEEEKTDNYKEVLESSNLRPDVEPFVPKANNHPQPPYFMVNGPGFSLDAPEFIPNVYPTDNGVYTWVPSPNQFIMPSTTHPRFLIPRFRDKFLRQQQRSRGYSNQMNGAMHRNYHEPHYSTANSSNNLPTPQQQPPPPLPPHTRHQHQPHPPPPPHKTYKIEQRGDRKVYDHKKNTPQAYPKTVQIEKKPIIRSKKDKAADKLNSPLPVPVVEVVDDGNTMSYRAALVGSIAANAGDVATAATVSPGAATNTTPVSTISTTAAGTGSAAATASTPTTTSASTTNTQTSDNHNETVKDNPGRMDTVVDHHGNSNGYRGIRYGGTPPNYRAGDYSNLNGGSETYYKPPYNKGRPKPTKGSGIQLNIFSLVQQDKKSKKKKASKNPQKRGVQSKSGNTLDSSAPEVRKGKEREDGKPKKLSKMKKIIDKEKTNDRVWQQSTAREYCHQAITPELNNSLKDFLAKLREFNDRAYKHGSNHKRRYCCGLREAAKYLKVNKVKCVIIPPNIDKVISKGGLDECVDNILSLSSQHNVPIFFGLNKTLISKILARPKSTITSAVSVFSYQGAELLYKQVEVNAAAAKERYVYLHRNDSNSEDADSPPSTATAPLNGVLNGEGGLEDNEDEVEEEEESSEGEEYPEDNNEEPGNEDDDDDASVSSSFVDSGIENNEVSSLSIENGHTSGEG